MIRNLRIAELVFNQPLMITESKLNVILHILGPRMGVSLVGLPPQGLSDGSDPSEPSEPYAPNGPAIIRVCGPLLHRCLASEYPSGGPTTYGEIRNAFDCALNDANVPEIKFEIDSPGGVSSGVFDLAEEIFQARGIKPITAVVNEQACSAAYLLAAACDRVVMPRTGSVGSIGVIATHADFSRAEDQAGVKVTHIFAGSHKADYSPHFPLSPEASANLQASVNSTYALFVETVARYRNMSPEDVRATEAQIYTGKKAVAVGLVDEILPADQELRCKPNNKQSEPGGIATAELHHEGGIMDRTELQAKHPALFNEVFESGKQEGMTSERSRVTAILGIPGPAAVAHKGLLLKGIAEGLTAGDVALSIQHKEAELLAKAGEDLKSGAPAPVPAGSAGDDPGSAEALNAALDAAVTVGAENWQKRQ